MTNPAIQQVLSIFNKRGQEAYHGEPVSQIEHAMQTAQLAQASHPEDHEFILAAFLHDIGHLVDSDAGEMDGYGRYDHESIGANTLRRLGFSEKIARLVENHVYAKRYLVSTDPMYFADLSAASKITLIKQGGLLSEEEQNDFENDPLFELHIALRRLDEQAKQKNQPMPGQDWLETMMQAHFSQTQYQ